MGGEHAALVSRTNWQELPMLFAAQFAVQHYVRLYSLHSSSAAACQAPTLHCSVLTRVHAAYAATKERAERAEAALEMSEATLAQERDSAAVYKVGRVAGRCCCCWASCGCLDMRLPAPSASGAEEQPSTLAAPQTCAKQPCL